MEMFGFGRWLNQAVSFASGIATVATWIGLSVSALFALGIGFWAWAVQWGYLPIALTIMGVFASCLWTYNGFVWLKRQNRPSPARVTFEYNYGLDLEAISIGLDFENHADTLEFRLVVKNVANGPMRVAIRKNRVQIADRFYESPTLTEFILPRGSSKVVFPGTGFGYDAFQSLPARTTGLLSYQASYGHPDDVLSRISKRQVLIDVFKGTDENNKQTVAINWIIKEESDDVVA